MPKPPYPYKARSQNVEGSGEIEVTCRADGSVKLAAMSKSTGSDELDKGSVNFALANWHGPAGATGKFPLIYRLR